MYIDLKDLKALYSLPAKSQMIEIFHPRKASLHLICVPVHDLERKLLLLVGGQENLMLPICLHSQLRGCLFAAKNSNHPENVVSSCHSQCHPRT